MKLSYNFPLQNELFLSEPKIKEHKNKDFVINPFYPNPPFKHQNPLQFSYVFSGKRKGLLGTNGLMSY